MKLILIFCWIWLFLCNNYIAKSQVNIEIADSLANAGNFNDADIEYERCIYQIQDDEYLRAQIIIKKAACNKLNGNLSKAIFELNRIHLNAITDSTLIQDTNYQLSLCYYLNDDMDKANEMMKKLSIHNSDVFLLKGLINIQNARWDSAKTNIIKYLNLASIPDQKKDSLIKDLERQFEKTPKLYSSQKLTNFSVLFPGIAQYLTGEVSEAITTQTLIASSLIYGIYQIFSKCYFTSYFVFFELGMKFYIGNIHRSKKIVNRYNKNKINEFDIKIKKFLMQIS